LKTSESGRLLKKFAPRSRLKSRKDCPTTMYYCTKCGSSVASGARFCSGCGAIAIDPELTRAAAATKTTAPRIPASEIVAPPATIAASSNIERVVFSTGPTLLFVKVGYAIAALCSLLLIVLLALANAPPLTSVMLGLAFLLVPGFYHIKRNAIRYTLTESKLEIDRGLVARSTRNVTLRNIQDVTVSISFAQRLLGLGDVVIDTTGESGSRIVLRNIRKPRAHADLLLRELRRAR
jgi:membrane protein YdbS with pleckstrin-like domain